jgi:hypothetical protein
MHPYKNKKRSLMKTTKHTQKAIRKISFIVSCILIFFTQLTSGQSSGEIHGQVINEETGEPVSFANVYIKIDNLIFVGTVADFEGYFRMKPVPVGTYILSTSLIGYGEVETVGVIVDADKITNVKQIHLPPGQNLPTVIIPWTKDIVDAEDPSKKTIDMIVAKKIPGSGNFNMLLTATTSDIYASEDHSEIHFRGSRANDAIYIVDGVKMVNTSSMIPTRGIGNMTIYSGGVPAKYGDFTGGVIIIESEGYFSWLSKERSKELMK